MLEIKENKSIINDSQIHIWYSVYSPEIGIIKFKTKEEAQEFVRRVEDSITITKDIKYKLSEIQKDLNVFGKDLTATQLNFIQTSLTNVQTILERLLFDANRNSN